MNSNKSVFLRGMRDGIPIALGYYAVAFSLGIIAKKAGLTALVGFVGSLLTRASAGEYGVYSLVVIQAAYAEVVAMCIVTNLRYLLMTTALAQKFPATMPFHHKFLTATCLTDEIFGISIAYGDRLNPWYTYGATATAAPAWALGCMSGIIAGGILPAFIVEALGVALYGMFIAIIIPPAKQDKAVAISIIVSFLLSYGASIAPLVSDISSGMRTIILTIVISAAAALLAPIKKVEP